MPNVGDIDVFTPVEGVEVVAPTGIIRGPDDRIWFTAIGNDRLGRVDPNTGEMEAFADPAGAIHLPANVYPGPDDRIWFTSLGTDRVGRIDPAAADPSRTIETFTAPGLSQPVAIKRAADDRIWFSLRGADALASIDPLADDPAVTIQFAVRASRPRRRSFPPRTDVFGGSTPAIGRSRVWIRTPTTPARRSR